MRSLWCMSHYQGYIRIVSVILRFSLSLHPQMFSTWKRMPKSLDSYSKVFKSLIFSYCTTLTVSEQITPICFSKKVSKQIICILSLTPVFFLSFYLFCLTEKLKARNFPAGVSLICQFCFVFFYCLISLYMALAVSLSGPLFWHYLHALMVCNLSRPICLLAYSSDSLIGVSPFLPQNMIDSPWAPHPTVFTGGYH